jgi:CelD/BcsL family acetyltransferase involved in cellulose biosynthesis
MASPIVETVTTLEGFDALAEEWDGLVAAMPRPSPFLLHAWLRSLWPLCDEPSVCVARFGGRLVGAFPLDVRRRSGLRVAEFIGGADAHLADLLLAPGEGTGVAGALVAEAGRMRFDYADLFGMPAVSRLERVGGLRLLERVEAPVLDLGRDWEAVYTAKASTKTRQTHRRKRRRLEELGRLEFSLATTAEEVAAALEETFRIHQLRWHGRRDGSGLARPEVRDAQRAGYRALAGTARILTLSLDGRTIAYNCCLVLGKRLYSHRLAFDPEYAQWSPGLLCTLELCERAAAEGVERVEFLGGGEDYKLQLADRQEPLFEGLGLARTARGRAVVSARIGLVVARRRLKRFRRLHRLYVEGLAPARRAIASVYTPR